jgi:protein O-mannosyl-transferase
MALGNRLGSYHLINLIFVILNAILLYRLAAFFLDSWWAIVPPVLLVTRFALVQMVLYTTEFQGLLYVFFTILSVDLFVRSRVSERTWMLALSGLAFGLALLSKESAIVLPGLLIAYGRLFEDRATIRPYLLHPMIAFSWAILFVLVLRHHQATDYVYDFSVSNVLSNYVCYFLDFSNWLLAPLQDLAMPSAVAAFAGTWYARLFAAVLIIWEIVLLLFPSLLKTRNSRLAAFGFAWFLIATLPFTIFQDRLFIRYSYLGHAGLALSAGAIVKGTFRSLMPLFTSSLSSNSANLAEPLLACLAAVSIAATSGMGASHEHLPDIAIIQIVQTAHPMSTLMLSLDCPPMPTLSAQANCLYWGRIIK